MTTRMTMRRFTKVNGVRIKSIWSDSNPNMDVKYPMNHYKCRLFCGTHKMDLYYSMGVAHCGNPTAAEVLNCLASDSASYANAGSFEEWCGDYGYDSDSRKAFKTWKIVKRQSEKLKTLLGADLYEKLLNETEQM